MDYVEETRTIHSESDSWSDATGGFYRPKPKQRVKPECL